MRTITRPATLAVFGTVAALALGACAGGGGSEKADGATNSAPAASTDAANASLAIEAHEFSLAPKDLRTAAGDVTISYTNAGAIQHTLLIEGVSGLKLDVMSAGDVDTGSVNLAPGTYTLYCDIAGHRSAGMEGQLIVS